MQSKHLVKFLFLTVGLLLCACSRQKIYSHFEHVSETGWEKIDTLDFFVPPVAESGTYHEDLEMRINNTFPFLSLTMEVSQIIFPDGRREKYSKDCELIDEDGTIKGAGISLFLYTFPLADIHLNRGDSLHIKVIHSMKREIMPGITDVGISLTRQ